MEPAMNLGLSLGAIHDPLLFGLPYLPRNFGTLIQQVQKRVINGINVLP
jgi:hypothetical protein